MECKKLVKRYPIQLTVNSCSGYLKDQLTVRVSLAYKTHIKLRKLAVYKARMLWPALQTYLVSWTWLLPRLISPISAWSPKMSTQRFLASNKMELLISLQAHRKSAKIGPLGNKKWIWFYLVSYLPSRPPKKIPSKPQQLAPSHQRRAVQIPSLRTRRNPKSSPCKSSSPKLLPKSYFSREMNQGSQARKTMRYRTGINMYPSTRGWQEERRNLSSSQKLRLPSTLSPSSKILTWTRR